MSEVIKVFVGDNGNQFEVFVSDEGVCIQGKYKNEDVYLHASFHPDDAKKFAREINKIANEILTP